MVYMENEIEIIRKCQEGNQEAFKVLVNSYQEKVFWIAYQMLGNHEEARDISQEAFVRVFKAINRFNLTNNFYTWLYRIVVNLCIDFLRKQKNSKPIYIEDIGELPEKDNEDKALELKELNNQIQLVLNKMPDIYKVIIVLRDIEGFSCKEIASILKSNHSTIRWRLFKARQIFKKIWEENYGEDIVF